MNNEYITINKEGRNTYKKKEEIHTQKEKEGE
jgi:hypothetical protein